MEYSGEKLWLRYVIDSNWDFVTTLIKNKNDALLHLKHDDYYIRQCCKFILKGEMDICVVK